MFRVTQRYHDNGKVTVSITEVDADTPKIEGSFATFDRYEDDFETMDAAKAFERDAINA